MASSDPRLRSTSLRVAARPRGGAVVFRPVPYLGAAEVRTFEEQVPEPRALRRRYSRDTTAR
ncbi:hypothetical protein ABZV75_25790 [Streptomyces flaveolus]|uniref:hypothetical protein n=1 Tax=Streptomyces flaveolus TaxID=67297 RepID=UPI0033AD6B4B